VNAVMVAAALTISQDIRVFPFYRRAD